MSLSALLNPLFKELDEIRAYRTTVTSETGAVRHVGVSAQEVEQVTNQLRGLIGPLAHLDARFAEERAHTEVAK